MPLDMVSKMCRDKMIVRVTMHDVNSCLIMCTFCILTFLSYLLRDLIGYHTALVASRARVVAASRVRVDQKDPNQRVESPQRAVHLPPLGVMMDGGVSLLTAHP